MRICDSCKKQPAIIQVVRVINGQQSEMSFCKSCAEVHGIREQIFHALDPNIESHPEMNPTQPMSSSGLPVDWERTCSRCGTTFEEFAHTGAVGCAGCYETFADLLDPVLRRMHGVTHRPAEGDVAIPRSAAAREQEEQTRLNFMVREDLEMELQLALLEEDYEKAATLRDKMKHL
jgi:protein arginine kinase activator